MQLTDLRIFPVKSLRGSTHREAIVEPWGLAGDRRWMVVDGSGRFVTQREHAAMALIAARLVPGGLVIEVPNEAPVDIAIPAGDADHVEVTVWKDTVPARLAPHGASEALGRALGMPCRLAYLHDTGGRKTDPRYAPADSTVTFADAFPLLLASAASLDDLNRRLPFPITMGRFRPNVVVEGAAPWQEDCWRRVRIGEVVFSVVKASDRCIMTTIDPETGERPDKREPLRTLARFRKDAAGGVMFGQNLVPENGGVIRIGDEVEILEQGAPNVVFAPEEAHSA